MVMKSIVTGEIYSQHSTQDIHIAIRRQAARSGIIWFGGAIPIDEEHPFLMPRVNHGRWLVDCPDCLGAELLDASDLFMCRSCWNVKHDHKYLRVNRVKDQGKIEAVLLERPFVENRNWTDETLRKLKAENKSNGVS